VSVVRQYAVRCDHCYVVVGWSPTAGTARQERHAAGWQRVATGRDLCSSCSAEAAEQAAGR